MDTATMEVCFWWIVGSVAVGVLGVAIMCWLALRSRLRDDPDRWMP